MPKSVSIPIALSELKRTSFQRISSKKEKKPLDQPMPRFIILVQQMEDHIRLFSATPSLEIGDEIVSVNEMQLNGQRREDVLNHVQHCIRTKVIQLKVKKQPADISEPGPSSTALTITDAFLVSVDKNNTKELIEELKKLYPSIRTFDMESIAANKLLSPIQATNTPIVPEQKRLQHYESDRQERLNNQLQRQKENEFLRKSLRSSKKLKSLAISKENSPNILRVDEPLETDGQEKTYENHSFERAPSADKEHNNNEAIPLNQVIVSVDRLTDHLTQLGNEEDVRVLREFFQSPPVREAIKETAAVRSSVQTKSSSFTNGTTTTTTDKQDESAVRVVTCHKEEDTYLGATVRNEDNRIIVGRVVQGGIVEKTGLFKQGDELIEMNGTQLRGKKVSEVCEMLKNISGEIRFVISTNSDDGVEKQTGPATIQHFRALFDYDPEDDVYIPCKELALKFERGDILHVLNRSDENWWQAYRDGEDTIHQLAGLIPSSSFHQQVVMYSEEIDKEFRPKRKTSKLIPEVIRTLGKKGSREVQRSLDEMNASPIGYHSDLLTYEEVSLHLSRSDHRRPLVICGPEGVGCLRLRKQLLELDNKKLASTVPYTTREAREGEVDGLHYHFVSKQRFQEDTKAKRFVEYGVYEKHLYGIARDDVIEVIKKGKTCVFTLKPESLTMIRIREIMPFIVFIAPPSLPVLRRQKEIDGKFGVKDEELKAILNSGKRIEQKYGHLFDAIIVNKDFDKSIEELQDLIKRLDTEPHWVPIDWTETSTER